MTAPNILVDKNFKEYVCDKVFHDEPYIEPIEQEIVDMAIDRATQGDFISALDLSHKSTFSNHSHEYFFKAREAISEYLYQHLIYNETDLEYLLRVHNIRYETPAKDPNDPNYVLAFRHFDHRTDILAWNTKSRILAKVKVLCFYTGFVLNDMIYENLKMTA